MLKKITLIATMLFCTQVCAENIISYLAKPTGRYGVSFEDFHWINSNICPDPNFNGTNQKDFSADNKNFCHEIMARVYYPTALRVQLGDLYYQPLVEDAKDSLRKMLIIPKDQIEQLSEVRSYSVEKAPIFAGKIFPVLFFSPGFGCQIEMYENFITELVSQGYIVVGVNSPFVSGDIALPNGHIVKFNEGESETDLMHLPTADFAYVYEQIHIMHDANPIFSAMDLHHVGAFGHSIGGNVVGNAAHAHANWFQAAATLDIGIDQSGASLKKYSIPFMHEISAIRISEAKIHTEFELGNENYLIGVTPDEANHDYSYHMNFTDESTEQYLPAYQTLFAFFEKWGKKLPIGKGNGWEITNTINTNLVQFFNTFLKDEKNPAFKDCKALSKASYMKCGPRIVP